MADADNRWTILVWDDDGIAIVYFTGNIDDASAEAQRYLMGAEDTWQVLRGWTPVSLAHDKLEVLGRKVSRG